MAYLLHDSTNNSDTDMSFVSKVFMNKSIKNTLLFSLSLLLVVSSLIVSNMFQQLENSRANTTCEQICDKFVAESVEFKNQHQTLSIFFSLTFPQSSAPL